MCHQRSAQRTFHSQCLIVRAVWILRPRRRRHGVAVSAKLVDRWTLALLRTPLLCRGSNSTACLSGGWSQFLSLLNIVKQRVQLLGEPESNVSAYNYSIAFTVSNECQLSISRPSCFLGAPATNTFGSALDTLESNGTTDGCSSPPHWTSACLFGHNQAGKFVSAVHGRVVQGRQKLRTLLFLILQPVVVLPAKVAVEPLLLRLLLE